MPITPISRRLFTKALAASPLSFPALLRAQNLNSKLSIAAIGVGGRGAGNLSAVASSETITALCDINSKTLDSATAKHPAAKRYTDFRKLFDHPNDFDAVVISTAEHTHFLATALALKSGKHVYCEKPLTHNIWEARQIRLLAEKANVATQMGIQIHASENFRRVVELIRASAIGPVRTVHVWVSRAWGHQSPEAAKRNKDIVTLSARPAESMTPPDHIDWDLWLGPAPYRPYHDVYLPGPKWYRWWDFGSGTMSDLGSHWNDLPFWALDLRAPTTIHASAADPHPDLAPATMSATYAFPARGNSPPVSLTWHQGESKPDLFTTGQIPKWDSAVLFVGDDGMLLSNYDKHLLLPEDKFKDYKRPEKSISPSPGHQQEWLAACKTGQPATANFTYAANLTESNHLGNLAFRTQQKLTWNPESLRTDHPSANALIKREPRKGWEL